MKHRENQYIVALSGGGPFPSIAPGRYTERTADSLFPIMGVIYHVDTQSRTYTIRGDWGILRDVHEGATLSLAEARASDDPNVRECSEFRSYVKPLAPDEYHYRCQHTVCAAMATTMLRSNQGYSRDYCDEHAADGAARLEVLRHEFDAALRHSEYY